MNVEEAVARRRALGTRGLALAACAALIAVVASSLTGVGLAVATSDMRSSSAAGGSGVGDAAATRKRRLRVTAAAIIALTSELRVSGTVIGASRATAAATCRSSATRKRALAYAQDRSAAPDRAKRWAVSAPLAAINSRVW